MRPVVDRIRWDHTPTIRMGHKKILGDFQKLEISNQIWLEFSEVFSPKR